MAKKKIKVKKRNLPKYLFGGESVGDDGKPISGISPAGGIGMGIDVLKGFIPGDDGNGLGVSAKGQKISGGIQKGLDAGAEIAGKVPGIGTAVAAGLKGASFLTKGITALVDMIKEKKLDARVDQTYDPINKNVQGAYSFGTIPQGAYGMPTGYQSPTQPTQVQSIEGPSHANDGVPIDTDQDGIANIEAEGGEAMTKEYIFSDRLGYDKTGKITISPKQTNKSFADIAKKIENGFKRSQQDKYAQKGKEIALAQLTKDAEMARVIKQQIEASKAQKNFAQGMQQLQAKYGAKLPKAENSSFINDITGYEGYAGGYDPGTGKSIGLVGNYGYNKGTNPSYSQSEVNDIITKDYLPQVQSLGVPENMFPQLTDYKYNSGRSLTDLLLYSQGKISLDQINSSKTFDDMWKTNKDALLQTFSANPQDALNKLVSARHDVAKTTYDKVNKKKYTLANPNPAYSGTWQDRINNLVGAETVGEGIGKTNGFGVLRNPGQYNPGELNYYSNLMKNIREGNLVSANTGIAKTNITNNTDREAQAPRTSGDRTFKGEEMGFTLGDKLNLASGAPATLFNAAMAMRKPEKEATHYNPYNQEIISLMKGRTFGTEKYMNEAKLANNAAKDYINNNTTSTGTKLANFQKLHSTNLKQVADINQKANEFSDNVKVGLAQTLGNVGSQMANEDIRVGGVNAANKARRQMFAAETANNLGDTLARTAAGMNQRDLNRLLAKTIGTQDFKFAGMNSSTIEKYTGQFNDLGVSDLATKVSIIRADLVKNGMDPNSATTYATYLANQTVKEKEGATNTTNTSSATKKQIDKAVAKATK